MYCKHCGAQVGDQDKTCSSCGKPVEGNKKMNKVLKIAVAVLLCLALALGLAYIVFLGAGGTWGDITDFTARIFNAKEQNVFYKDSYTANEKKLHKTGNTVVATLDGVTLTNNQLQVFYWTQVYIFIEQCGGYTSYYGLDLSKPLDEQVWDSESGQTWQQAFLESALSSWSKFVLITNDAERNGYKLPEEYQKQLDNLETDIAAEAASNGFGSAEEMLQKDYGKGVTVEDYRYYLRMYRISNLYLEYLVELNPATQAEIDNWYENNQASLNYYGIDKESGNMSDVRHLLVSIEEIAGEKKEEYSPEDWEACRQKAQTLLYQWQEGEKTEDSFTALVKEHSDDTNSVPYGGFIDYVFKNSGYVEAFEDWCANTSRAKGDCELVKSEYGYHIMYCVSTEPAWMRASRDSIMSERYSELANSYTATGEIKYKKIALMAVDMSTN